MSKLNKVEKSVYTMGGKVSGVQQELASLKNKIRQAIRWGGVGLILFGFFKDLIYGNLTWHYADGIGGQQKLLIFVGLILLIVSMVKGKR